MSIQSKTYLKDLSGTGDVITQDLLHDLIDSSVATTQGTDGSLYNIRATNEGVCVGNARGENSVDLQTYRQVATQVASGESSVIGGGRANTSSNYYSTVGGGNTNTASGASSTVGGGWCNTASGASSTVGGGYGNTSQGHGSFVAGYCSHACNSTSSDCAFGAVALGTGANTTGGTWSATYFSDAPTICNAGCFSTVGGGLQNSASGQYSTVGGGRGNTASGESSTVSGGSRGLANRYGQRSYASGGFSDTLGSAQQIDLIARNVTTDATPTNVFLDGSSVVLTITEGTALFATVNVAGIKSDGSAGAHYIRKVAIKNVGGTTALIGTVSTIGTDVEDDAGYDVTIAADDTNDALDIKVTGKALETLRWVTHIQGVEIIYGT